MPRGHDTTLAQRPCFSRSDLDLCWVLRSVEAGEKIRLEVTRSSIQPRTASGEWTDYALVYDGKHNFRF